MVEWMKRIISTTDEMEAFGAELAKLILQESPGEHMFIALHGNLGAGKTVITRGFASVLSPGSRVKSPTYTLVNEYRKGAIPVFHFDLYRAEEEDDLASLGLDDYINHGHCIVEWSEYLRKLPENAISLYIEVKEDDSRLVRVIRLNQ